jgi:hypothetical protein
MQYDQPFCLNVCEKFIKKYTRAAKKVEQVYPTLTTDMLINWIAHNNSRWYNYKRVVKFVQHTLEMEGPMWAEDVYRAQIEKFIASGYPANQMTKR